MVKEELYLFNQASKVHLQNEPQPEGAVGQVKLADGTVFSAESRNGLCAQTMSILLGHW